MTRIELPWPSSDLSPNARGHWSKKARATKQARSVAAWKATGSRSLESFKGKKISVTATFSPPDSRRRDTDNMLASIKPYLDGIADVIGVDDSKWDLHIRRGDVTPLGAVLIDIEVRS